MNKSCVIARFSLVLLAAVSFSQEASAFGRKGGGYTEPSNPSKDPCYAPPLPSNSGLRVDVASADGFYDSQKDKLSQAARNMERVINSAEFRERVLSFYNPVLKSNKFTSSDLTPAEVYAKIMAGRETYLSAEDGVAQMCVSIYTPPFYKKWSVVGYTYPDQPRIYMNSYYFNSFEPEEVSGNMTHEWLHKIGFDHDYNDNAARPYSVPYFLGELVIELSKKLN